MTAPPFSPQDNMMVSKSRLFQLFLEPTFKKASVG
jgi:hypothetical protein